MKLHPTRRTYASLDKTYEHLNRALFGNELPPCLITMQRKKGAYGFFSPGRFARLDVAEDITDEIALNPAHFHEGPQEILSTLVHEMVHLWQQHFGKAPRRCYHDKQWAAKMREVGLIPSNTGLPGGKQTGQRMTHYVEPGGRFEQACAAYLEHARAIFYRDVQDAHKKAASKTKYTCPACGQNAWAKPDANLMCGDCERTLESAG